MAEWTIGATAYFEYHCLQSHESGDAEAWYRSQQPVEIVARVADVDEEEVGGPMYRVRFRDSYEHEVFNDELLTRPESYNPTWSPGDPSRNPLDTRPATLLDSRP